MRRPTSPFSCTPGSAPWNFFEDTDRSDSFRHPETMHGSGSSGLRWRSAIPVGTGGGVEKRFGPGLCRPSADSMALRVDHAEEVPFGVGEDHEVLARLAGPMASGAEPKQPFDLSFLVVRVQVE